MEAQQVTKKHEFADHAGFDSVIAHIIASGVMANMAESVLDERIEAESERGGASPHLVFDQMVHASRIFWEATKAGVCPHQLKK